MFNKKIKLALLFTVVLGGQAVAQNTSDSTAVVKVWGNCGMCEERIEKAAFGKGVKSAEWNAETLQLTVVYNPKKTDLLTIEKRISSVGHDTEHTRASDKVYNNLHGCCQYDRPKQ
jgi:Ni,Fe-hydrogenase III small subunit